MRNSRLAKNAPHKRLFFFSFGVKLRLIQFSFFFQLNYLKNAYRRPRPVLQAVQLNLK